MIWFRSPQGVTRFHGNEVMLVKQTPWGSQQAAMNHFYGRLRIHRSQGLSFRTLNVRCISRPFFKLSQKYKGSDHGFHILLVTYVRSCASLSKRKSPFLSTS
jgi:hypothetical protein